MPNLRDEWDSPDHGKPEQTPERQAAVYTLRLVNAAPDLLAALQRAQNCIRLLIRQAPVRDVGETLAEIEAAIAKAEGK